MAGARDGRGPRCPVSPSRCSHSVGAGLRRADVQSRRYGQHPTKYDLSRRGWKLEGQEAGDKRTRAPGLLPVPESRPAEPGGRLLYDGHDGVLPAKPYLGSHAVCQLGGLGTSMGPGPNVIVPPPVPSPVGGTPLSSEILVSGGRNIRLSIIPCLLAASRGTS